MAILDAQPAPVILVGHSAGGITISQAAEARPDKIAALVYVAAYLLPSAETLFAAATADVDSQLGPNLIVDEAQGVMTVKPEAFADLFYHDIPAAVAAPALARSQPEPLAPLATPLATTAERFGGVRRIYVETRLDRVVSPVLQQTMYTALPCEQVLTIDTEHAPFLAQPEQLAGLLTAV